VGVGGNPRQTCKLATRLASAITKRIGSTNAQIANYLAILMTFVANGLTQSITEIDRVRKWNRLLLSGGVLC
jgi:hypothetical protein